MSVDPFEQNKFVHGISFEAAKVEQTRLGRAVLKGNPY
jgi:hypothetical protein